MRALEIADSGDLDIAAPLRRGRALVEILRWFLDNQNLKRGGRNRPHLNIIVNAETLGTEHVEGYDLTTGMTLSSDSLERLLCDCDLHRVMNVESEIVDFGRTIKTPPPELWNGIVIRDRHCRWKGCDRPASWCHAHHVKWWHRDFGPTSLRNLVLLCERHHGMLHRKGWSARLDADGTLHVTDPNGLTWSTKPPGLAGLPPPDPAREHPLIEHVRWIEAKSVVRAWAAELTRARAA